MIKNVIKLGFLLVLASVVVGFLLALIIKTATLSYIWLSM